MFATFHWDGKRSIYYELLQFQIKLSISINISINSFNLYNVSNEFERMKDRLMKCKSFSCILQKRQKKYHLFFRLENSPACVNPPLILWPSFIWLFIEISISFDRYALLNIGKNAKTINDFKQGLKSFFLKFDNYPMKKNFMVFLKLFS